jgi:pimeloyl-ACP methyl ester carboxylesterase
VDSERRDKPALLSLYWRMSSDTHFLGCTFAFREQGSGEPIVFIQGVGLHGDGWQPQTRDLSRRFRTISFDNRGMGASQPLGAPLTAELMASDTLAIMDAAGMSSAHLVGHSLGGCIAQQVALDAPQRVKSLSLLCTSARGADATDLSWKMLRLGIRSRVGLRRMRRLAFLEMVLSPQYLNTHDREQTALDLAPIFGHDLADTPPVVMKQLTALKRFNTTSRVATLASIPTFVLSAQHDIIFPPRCGRALAEAIPGSQFVEVAGAAHGATIEHADLINQLLAKQIRQAS